MKSKVFKIFLGTAGIIATPIVAASAKINSNKPNENGAIKGFEFKDDATLGGMQIWNMQYDNKGKILDDQYVGVVVPTGKKIDDNEILELLKNNSNATVKWDKKYDNTKKGIYKAVVSQNSNNFVIKIFVTDNDFYFEKDEKAFSKKTLPKAFRIPENVNRIGFEAFKNSKLNDGFSLSEAVTSIGEGSFSNIAQLPESFTLPHALNDIQSFAFKNTGLSKNFRIWENIDSINAETFYGSKLNEDFVIPKSVNFIDSDAFKYATLNDKFRFPEKLTTFDPSSLSKATFDSIDLNVNAEDSVKDVNKKFEDISATRKLILQFINDENRSSILNKHLSSEKLEVKKIFESLINFYNSKLIYNADIVTQYIDKINNENGVNISFKPSLKNQNNISLKSDEFADNIVKKEIHDIKPETYQLKNPVIPSFQESIYKKAINNAISSIDTVKNIKDLESVRKKEISKVRNARNILLEGIYMSTWDYQIQEEINNKNGNVVIKKNCNPDPNMKLKKDNLNIKAPKGFTYKYIDSTNLQKDGSYKVTISINLDIPKVKLDKNKEIFPKGKNSIFAVKPLIQQNDQKTDDQNYFNYHAHLNNKTDKNSSSKNLWWIIPLAISLFVITSLLFFILVKKYKKSKNK